MGSETEFCLRASAAGYKTGFANGPQVQHIVRAHQITPEFRRSRAYRLGRGAAQQQWSTGTLSYVPRGLAFRLVAKLFRAIQLEWKRLKASIPGEQAAFERQWDFEFHRGFQTEHQMRKEMARQGET